MGMKASFFFLAFFAAASPLVAVTYTVTNDASSGPGSFLAAMSSAKDQPDGTEVEIAFDPVYFAVPRTIQVIPLTLPEVSRKSLDIQGPPLINGRPSLTLSGGALTGSNRNDQTNARGIWADALQPGQTFRLSHLAMQGFYGAVLVTGTGGETFIHDCHFTGNTDFSGGALSLLGAASHNVYECVFTGNAAEHGGAIAISSAANISTSLFTGNTASEAGSAIYSSALQPVIQECSFLGNAAAGDGAAFYATQPVRLYRSTFARNSGGALAIIDNTLVTLSIIENCTLVENSLAGGSGSAMRNVGGIVNVEHCTIVRNVATPPPGVLPAPPAAAVDHRGAAGRINLLNCVIAGNTAPGAPATEHDDLHTPDAQGIASNGGSVVGILPAALTALFPHGTDISGTSASPLDARMGPLQSNGGSTHTCAPMKSSPAINRVTFNPPSSQDQRFAARPSGAGLDSGAVEFRVFNYSQWADIHSFPPGQAGQNDDPDGDGARNLLEYFTGTDPLSPSPSILSVNLSGNQMRMTYPVADHVAPNLFQPAFQISQNLSNWNPSVQTPVLVGQEGNTSRYEVFFNAGIARRFARMYVELIPAN